MAGCTKEATRIRMMGAEPSIQISQEMKDFMEKWGLERRDLQKILDMPEGTVNSILYNRSRPLVEARTVEKIRKGMRNYDPRTCRLRKLKASEVANVFRRMMQENNLSITDFCAIIELPRWKWYRYLNGRTPMVHSEEVRLMVARFNDWKRKQEQRWEADERAVQLTNPNGRLR